MTLPCGAAIEAELSSLAGGATTLPCGAGFVAALPSAVRGGSEHPRVAGFAAALPSAVEGATTRPSAVGGATTLPSALGGATDPPHAGGIAPAAGSKVKSESSFLRELDRSSSCQLRIPSNLVRSTCRSVSNDAGLSDAVPECRVAADAPSSRLKRSRSSPLGNSAICVTLVRLTHARQAFSSRSW